MKKSLSLELKPKTSKSRPLTNVWDIIEKAPELGKKLITERKSNIEPKKLKLKAKKPIAVQSKSTKISVPHKSLDDVVKRKEELCILLDQLEKEKKTKKPLIKKQLKKKTPKTLPPYYIPAGDGTVQYHSTNDQISKTIPSADLIPMLKAERDKDLRLALDTLPVQDFDLFFKNLDRKVSQDIDLERKQKLNELDKQLQKSASNIKPEEQNILEVQTHKRYELPLSFQAKAHDGGSALEPIVEYRSNDPAHSVPRFHEFINIDNKLEVSAQPEHQLKESIHIDNRLKEPVQKDNRLLETIEIKADNPKVPKIQLVNIPSNVDTKPSPNSIGDEISTKGLAKDQASLAKFIVNTKSSHHLIRSFLQLGISTGLDSKEQGEIILYGQR